MQIVTKKLKENEFMTLEDINFTYPFHILFGGANSGKSQLVQDYIVSEIEKGYKFVYIRNTKKELFSVLSWLGDSRLPNLKKRLTGCENPHYFNVTRSKPKKGDLYIHYQANEDDEITSKHIGYCISLDESLDFKSIVANDVRTFVFEEFARIGLPINIERANAYKYIRLVETVLRPENPEFKKMLENKEVNFFNISNNEMGISVMELMFSKSPYVIKYKIFKKRAKEGIFSNLQFGFSETLEGENWHKKPNLNRYIPLVNVRIKNYNYIIYRHKHLNIYAVRIGSEKYQPNVKTKLLLYFFLEHIEQCNMLYYNDMAEINYKNNFDDIKESLEVLLYD